MWESDGDSRFLLESFYCLQKTPRLRSGIKQCDMLLAFIKQIDTQINFGQSCTADEAAIRPRGRAVDLFSYVSTVLTVITVTPLFHSDTVHFLYSH